MISFLGVHIGRHSLQASILALDGCLLKRVKRLFSAPENLSPVLQQLFSELSTTEAWQYLKAVGVGLEKNQEQTFPHQALASQLPSNARIIVFPAPAAILAGAAPDRPSILISIGSELRLVAIDTLHKYYDYRLPAGGGYWWAGELRKLAQHSTQLKNALAGISSPDDIMKALPRLLTKADFPSPDPVLKISLDGISKEVAQNCLGLASRLPGVKSASFSGFLHPSPFSKRIATACSSYLSICSPKFPADVGGALLALALYRENEERLHLGKPLETGEPANNEWAPSPTVMRRLYRLKRPFEKYQAPTLSRDG